MIGRPDTDDKEELKSLVRCKRKGETNGVCDCIGTDGGIANKAGQTAVEV